MGDIKYSITPQEVLEQQGLKLKSNGNWWSLQLCPFCDGGRSGQQYTFGVHKFDGNYNCLRTTCGEASNFWNLLKHYGYNPVEYIDKQKSTNNYGKKKKDKKFIYRRQ